MARKLKRLLGAAILYFTTVWGFALLIWAGHSQDITYVVALGAAHLLLGGVLAVMGLISVGINLLSD